jgi:syntaxin 1B/2/3
VYEYRDTLARRYFTVTGSQHDETMAGRAGGVRGGGAVPAARHRGGAGARGGLGRVVAEIQERHGAVAELERGLLELQQVFNDMAVLVAAQGEQLDDIEGNVGPARSFVDRGREQLQVARKHQKSTRKWTCIVILFAIVLPIVLKNVNSNKN